MGICMGVAPASGRGTLVYISYVCEARRPTHGPGGEHQRAPACGRVDKPLLYVTGISRRTTLALTRHGP